MDRAGHTAIGIRERPSTKERYMEKRLNALETALMNEMNEHHFYKKNAARSKNAVGKAMFEQIAGEELEHYERLKQLSESWKKDKKWPETIPLKVKNTEVRSIFGRATQEYGKKAAAGDPEDLKAVREAIAFEAKGAAFYAQLRDQSSDPKEKAFFGLLADIEHEHFSSLKDTEEYFSNPGGWFQKAERSGLDGA
jgi:rubrerythrin